MCRFNGWKHRFREKVLSDRTVAFNFWQADNIFPLSRYLNLNDAKTRMHRILQVDLHLPRLILALTTYKLFSQRIRQRLLVPVNRMSKLCWYVLFRLVTFNNSKRGKLIYRYHSLKPKADVEVFHRKRVGEKIRSSAC